MFGFVKIAENELKVKEWRMYKAYYCKLCRQIANYSLFSRLMLSYDMVFLAMLLGTQLHEEKEQCKHRVIRLCRKRCGDLRIDYTAAVSVILQYQKLKNDVIDGDTRKKYAMYAIDSGYRKAAKRYPNVDCSINDSMKQLLLLERSRCANYALLQDCFAEILSSVVKSAPIDDELLEIKAKLIYHVAAWVYLFDMLIDMDVDMKSGSFNAILLNGGKSVQNDVYAILSSHIHEAELLSNLLPFSDEASIIQNVISFGLPLQMLDNNAFANEVS